MFQIEISLSWIVLLLIENNVRNWTNRFFFYYFKWINMIRSQMILFNTKISKSQFLSIIYLIFFQIEFIIANFFSSHPRVFSEENMENGSTSYYASLNRTKEYFWYGFSFLFCLFIFDLKKIKEERKYEIYDTVFTIIYCKFQASLRIDRKTRAERLELFLSGSCAVTPTKLTSNSTLLDHMVKLLHSYRQNLG